VVGTDWSGPVDYLIDSARRDLNGLCKSIPANLQGLEKLFIENLARVNERKFVCSHLYHPSMMVDGLNSVCIAIRPPLPMQAASLHFFRNDWKVCLGYAAFTPAKLSVLSAFCPFFVLSMVAVSSNVVPASVTFVKIAE
jgi:hypothetical protein